MPLRLLFIAGVPIVLLIGVAAASFRKPEESPDRPILAVLPILLYLTVTTCVVHLFLYWDPGWDSSRLFPSVAFSRGINVYSTTSHGAVQTTMYPPGWIIAFLPAALASSPTGVILAGYGLAQALTMLPMLAFLLVVAGRTAAAVAAFPVFVFALAWIEPLVVGFRPHADAPGLGFGLLACCLLWVATRTGHDRSGLLLLLSTIAAWCSVWSKQVMAPIVPAMALWILMAAGFRPFVRFCGYVVVSGAAVAAGFFAIFPVEGVLFNVLRIPARVPWQGRTPGNLLQAGYELLGFGWLLVLPLTAAAIFPRDRARNESRLRTFGSHVWSLPALAALFLSTTSILGRAKVGGMPNNLSPALYFLVAAVCLLIADTGSREGPFRETIAQRQFARFLMSASLVLAALWSLQLLGTMRGMSGMVVGRNAAQQAYDYLKKGGVRDVYFPTMPLVHLMADGEVFHFSSAIYDREVLARFPMSLEQRTRHFPQSPRLVCWKDPAWGTEYVQPAYFSSYTETVRVDDLPDFRCTARPKG